VNGARTKEEEEKCTYPRKEALREFRCGSSSSLLQRLGYPDLELIVVGTDMDRNNGLRRFQWSPPEPEKVNHGDRPISSPPCSVSHEMRCVIGSASSKRK
jgi:hypothetical protein